MVTKGHILISILNFCYHQALRVNEKKAVKGESYSEK